MMFELSKFKNQQGLEAIRSANAKQAQAISTRSALPLVVHAC